MPFNAKQMLADSNAARDIRAVDMPTEHDVLRALMQCYGRLQDLGWRDIIHCPKDGTVFDSISFGSTGIHDCHYDGEWPTGSWWVHEAGDLWPARPIVYRLKKS